MRFGQCLACLAVALLGLGANLQGAQFTAKWIGQADGGWNDAANWDIGQVPNNTTTDAYDVIWDSRPVTVRLGSDIAIRNFTFASGGVITELVPRFNFTIEGAFEWTHGTIAVSGQTIVKGPANLEGATPDSLILDAGVLLLKGHTDLYSNLQWLNNDKIVNDVGAVFEAHDGSSMVRKANRTFVFIENRGKFRILTGANTFPCVQIVNSGLVEIGARTVEFQAGSFTDILQQEGELSLDDAIIKGKVTVENPGKLQGAGYVREGETFDGSIAGRLTFDLLTLGAEATTTLTLSGRADGSYDRLSIDHNLQLSGKLGVRLANGFVPEPGDDFTIVTVAGGISGRFNDDRFNPINFGTRIPVTGGNGSFLLAQTADLKSIVLRDFVGGPFTLGAGALAFHLPTVEGESGGCFVGPNALINLADGNWAGGSLKVEIISGYDPTLDRFEFRENPALTAGEFVIDGPLDGDRVASFRGVAFGTVRIAGAQMRCVFNENARNEAIVALLGHLYYSNSQLNANWFTEALARYPKRTFQFDLIDGAGSRNQLTQDVSFPYLTGIGFDVSLAIVNSGDNDSTVNLQGRFSNSQRLYVIELKTVWTSDCDPPIDFLNAIKPGVQPFSTGRLKAHCSITAKSGPFEASVGVLQRSCVLDFILAAAAQPPSSFALHANANTQPGISLATFYTLQSLMTESAEGKRLVDLYWQHTSEVVQILNTNASLRDQAISIIRTFQPGVSKLLSGKGGESPITQTMIDQLNILWNGLASVASPALRGALLQEQGRFNAFQQFVNKEFLQWAGLLGVPAPTQPRIQISSVTWTANRFSFEINDVGGGSISLWRSADLTDWAVVSNGGLLQSDFTLRFADPTPPPERAFYQIRR